MDEGRGIGCYVGECTHRSTECGLMVYVPKETEKRKTWLTAMGLDWKSARILLTCDLYICWHHMYYHKANRQSRMVFCKKCHLDPDDGMLMEKITECACNKSAQSNVFYPCLIHDPAQYQRAPSTENPLLPEGWLPYSEIEHDRNDNPAKKSRRLSFVEKARASASSPTPQSYCDGKRKKTKFRHSSGSLQYATITDDELWQYAKMKRRDFERLVDVTRIQLIRKKIIKANKLEDLSFEEREEKLAPLLRKYFDRVSKESRQR